MRVSCRQSAKWLSSGVFVELIDDSVSMPARALLRVSSLKSQCERTRTPRKRSLLRAR
ncbi:MAG: hypothetical protein OJF50_006584 [Nitrospira sp.]|nr:hypothetical protein [Nitrospira sp.]